MPFLPNLHVPNHNGADREQPNISEQNLVSDFQGHPVVQLSQPGDEVKSRGRNDEPS